MAAREKKKQPGYLFRIVQDVKVYRRFPLSILHISSSRSVSHSTHSHFQLQSPVHQNQGLNLYYMATMMNALYVLALLHFKPTNSSRMITQMYRRGTRNSVEAIVFAKVFVNQTIGHIPHHLVLMELEPLHSLDAVLSLHELWTLIVGVSSHHLQNEFDLR